RAGSARAGARRRGRAGAGRGQGMATVSVGVCGALVRDGRVLMVRQAYNNRYGKGAGHWFVPGGYVQPGETLAEAVVREIREETGIVRSEERRVGKEGRSRGWPDR